jgi:long-chain acyl-CoA synthetase
MSDKPWLAHYPPSVPAEIDADSVASLPALFRASFERYADAPAFSNLGTEMTFGEVDVKSRAFAAYLSQDLKLARGDRVAVMLPNVLSSPVVICGILRAGLVAVNVNPLYTKRELEHQLEDSGARVIVVLENFAGTVEAALGGTPLETVVVAALGDDHGALKRWAVNFAVRHVKRLVKPWHIRGAVRYREALEAGAELDYRDPELAPTDLAFLQYTGGTTGVAKGAMLTHRNMVANVLQAKAWVGPFFSGKDGNAITALPLYHIFALTVNLFCLIELGARNVLVTNPRDLKAFVKVLAAERFAFITGVNTLFNALLNQPAFERVDFGNLKIALGGGMAVQADVAERWHKVTGRPIAQGYGLTETSPIVTANRLDIDRFNGSVGLPFPSTEVVILDDEGRRAPPGGIGEICVRGPQVMAGYWNRPDETSETLTDDGWLKTGDIGRLDDSGRLFIEDRKKDLIIVSGFNVYPNEVEDVVTSHPGVLEAAAVGVPDPRSGEAVKIFVVKKDASLTAEELTAYCRERLTGYKTPDFVEFIDALPKSNVGKVLRRELKDRDHAASAPRRRA